MALVILASALSRPPGVMLDIEGGEISYVICSGDGVKTITVSLDGEHDIPEQVDPECAFFASQVAALPNLGTDATRISVGLLIRQSQFVSDLQTRQSGRLSNAVRAPPLESEHS